MHPNLTLLSATCVRLGCDSLLRECERLLFPYRGLMLAPLLLSPEKRREGLVQEQVTP